MHGIVCVERLGVTRTIRVGVPKTPAEADAAAAPTAHSTPHAAGDGGPPLPSLFRSMKYFSHRSAGAGGPELKLYDAMTSPDRQLIKAGYFVAEGALVVQQLLRLRLSLLLRPCLHPHFHP
mgnify:CR=1 FL=1